MSTICFGFEMSGRERWKFRRQNWLKWNECCWCCCWDDYLNELTFSAMLFRSSQRKPFQERGKKCREDFTYLNFLFERFFWRQFFYLFDVLWLMLWHFLIIIICQVDSSIITLNKILITDERTSEFLLGIWISMPDCGSSLQHETIFES